MVGYRAGQGTVLQSWKTDITEMEAEFSRSCVISLVDPFPNQHRVA